MRYHDKAVEENMSVLRSEALLPRGPAKGSQR